MYIADCAVSARALQCTIAMPLAILALYYRTAMVIYSAQWHALQYSLILTFLEFVFRGIRHPECAGTADFVYSKTYRV